MPLNLLQVDTEIRWGGGQKQVVELCRGLVGRGHSVTLVCHKDGALLDRVDKNVRALPLPSLGEIDPRGVLGLARILRREPFDLMHMHSSRAHTMGVAAGTLARFRPRVVTRRSHHALKKDPFNRWKYGHGTDRVVAISQAIRQSLIDSGVTAEQVDLVPSGINPKERMPGARISVLEEFKLSSDSTVAVCVANLVEPKGHQVLINAATKVIGRFPRLHLILAGEGPMRETLEALSRKLGSAEHVHFAGFRSDIPRLLSAADLAVCPSLREGLGLAILDALALELPVVASETGGIPEIILHEETGLLVPPGEPDALARAMISVLASPDNAGRLGRNGRELVLTRFTVEAMVEGTEKVYSRMVRQPGQPLS